RPEPEKLIVLSNPFEGRGRMDIHKNARLTLISREELAKRVSQQGWTLKAAAAAFNVSAKTAAKWVGRYRELGREGLGDRSSRPQRSPCRTGADRVAQVEALRREGWTGFRIAFSDLLPNQKAASAAAFLRAAVAYYARFGICIHRVLTDNGPCYRSGRFRRACRELGVTQRFTRPYTPRTNGKAERFIQTALREWAYGRAYDNSGLRAAELSTWLHQYNWHRPHASLDHAPPISRAGL